VCVLHVFIKLLTYLLKSLLQLVILGLGLGFRLKAQIFGLGLEAQVLGLATKGVVNVTDWKDIQPVRLVLKHFPQFMFTLED